MYLRRDLFGGGLLDLRGWGGLLERGLIWAGLLERWRLLERGLIWRGFIKAVGAFLMGSLLERGLV